MGAAIAGIVFIKREWRSILELSIFLPVFLKPCVWLQWSTTTLWVPLSTALAPVYDWLLPVIRRLNKNTCELVVVNCSSIDWLIDRVWSLCSTESFRSDFDIVVASNLSDSPLTTNDSLLLADFQNTTLSPIMIPVVGKMDADVALVHVVQVPVAALAPGTTFQALFLSAFSINSFRWFLFVFSVAFMNTTLPPSPATSTDGKVTSASTGVTVLSSFVDDPFPLLPHVSSSVAVVPGTTPAPLITNVVVRKV